MRNPIATCTLVALVLLGFSICSGELQLESNFSQHHCPLWSYYDPVRGECNHTIYYAVSYLDNRTLLRIGYCSTYDEEAGTVSFSPCPYFQSDDFVVRVSKYNIWYIDLPRNISTLNDYMCGPLNRKGRVCSECRDGFGPSVISVGFNIQCSNCTGVWYQIPLYLFLEFVPITIVYVLILLFPVNVTSAPMTCFIMYSQLIALWWGFAFNGEDYNISRQMFVLNDYTEWIRKILLTIYDVWNLRFFHQLVPPFCISSKLKPFHIGLLSYISIFYPLCLIILTKICINLRDRDFKPLVCLSNAFLNHRCCVTLRRGWSRKGDIIDVFASVFLLSFSKVMYQADMLISYQTIWDKQYSNLSIRLGKSFVTNIDLTVPYGSAQHMLYAIPAVLFMCVFNIVPTLLLLLYPFKVTRRCLSKCRLDTLALKFFVERFYACYREGFKSFAGLYFVLRPMLFVMSSILSQMYFSNMDPYFSRNVVLTLTALLVGLCRPYKEMYMNVLDTLLLVHFGLFCHLISSYQGFYQNPSHASFVYTFEAMLALPIVCFFLFLAWRAFQKTCGPRLAVALFQKCKLVCTNWSSSCRSSGSDSDHSRNSLSVEQLLIEPIEAGECDYGAINYY